MPFDSTRQLDVSPLIRALHEQPEDFALHEGIRGNYRFLMHPKSAHRFMLRTGDRPRIEMDAHCGCCTLKVADEDAARVADATDQWEKDHWQGEVARVGAHQARCEVEERAVNFASQQHIHYGYADVTGFAAINAQFAAHFEPTPEQAARIEAKREAARVEAERLQREAELRNAKPRKALRERLGEWLGAREPALAGGDD